MFDFVLISNLVQISLQDSNKVLGIEIVSKAVQDARENASKNSVDNSEFFCGKADEIITSVVKRVKEDKLVAILDPPRAGLRKYSNRLIYYYFLNSFDFLKKKIISFCYRSKSNSNVTANRKS